MTRKMENFTVKPLAPVNMALEIMSIQVRLYKLASATPYVAEYKTFRDRLMDACINLASATFCLDLPDNENV